VVREAQLASTNGTEYDVNVDTRTGTVVSIKTDG